MTEAVFYYDVDYSVKDNDDYFRKQLDKYFTQYVCGRETSKSGIKHYQVYATEGSKNSYINFKQKVVKHFKLSGQTKEKGKRRQYGRAKALVKNQDSMISYCLKEKDYFWKGYDDDYIKARADASYEKVTTEDLYEKFIKLCGDTLGINEGGCNIHMYSNYETRIFAFTLISQTYFDIYDKVLPRFKTTKILMDLGILGHEEYAKSIFGPYLKPPSDIERSVKIRTYSCDNCNLTKNEVFEKPAFGY